MLRFVFALVSLLWTGHGREERKAKEQVQGSFSEADPLKALALVFLGCSPSAAWQAAGAETGAALSNHFGLRGGAPSVMIVKRSKATHLPVNRLLSKLGLASRKEAGDLILRGAVTVNKRVVIDPELWVPRDAEVQVDGTDAGYIDDPVETRVIMMHKKRGMVVARKDDRHPVVCDHPELKDTDMNPVGRLDLDSEGLLLFTNDNQLANSITDPVVDVPKIYFVRVDRPLTYSELKDLGDPSRTNFNGELKKPSKWSSMEEERNVNWIKVELYEGKKRQIRRMLKDLGVNVQRLVRMRVGPLELGSLERGSVRELTSDEVAELQSYLVRSDKFALESEF
mmetsp:Transcript_138039/g.240054  ORF Transcript_138039/g.240054 Transcript_138039/m.240054 type:complete len:339 (+) Transcript_138039:64-1080(+)